MIKSCLIRHVRLSKTLKNIVFHSKAITNTTPLIQNIKHIRLLNRSMEIPIYSCHTEIPGLVYDVSAVIPTLMTLLEIFIYLYK